MSLSRALDGRLPEANEPSAAGDDVEACARARATLTESITAFCVSAAPPTSAESGSLDDNASRALAFAPFKKHCLDMQRAMLASTGRLRDRLRERLAQGSPQQARLAVLDAEMEAVLSPREHALLSLLPRLLEGHFESLHRVGASQPQACLEIFRRDLRDVLLGELDIRFQPIEALLAALRNA